jgi:hypothetical protein
LWSWIRISGFALKVRVVAQVVEGEHRIEVHVGPVLERSRSTHGFYDRPRAEEGLHQTGHRHVAHAKCMSLDLRQDPEERQRPHQQSGHRVEGAYLESERSPMTTAVVL